MSPTSRRSFLGLLAGSTTVTLAGCFGSPEPAAPPATGTNADAESTTTPSSPSASTRTTNPSSQQTPLETTETPVRCEGEPLAATRVIGDEPGYERPNGIEYFPENRTVRFVMARNADGPVRFDTWTFEQWGGIQSARVAIDHVRSMLADRIGTDRIGSGISTPVGQDGGYDHVVVLTLVSELEDGTVVEGPPVPLDRLVARAPRGVDVTLRLEGDEYARTVPVYAEHLTTPSDW